MAGGYNVSYLRSKTMLVHLWDSLDTKTLGTLEQKDFLNSFQYLAYYILSLLSCFSFLYRVGLHVARICTVSGCYRFKASVWKFYFLYERRYNHRTIHCKSKVGNLLDNGGQSMGRSKTMNVYRREVLK